jgi:hypothetical protein
LGIIDRWVPNGDGMLGGQFHRFVLLGKMSHNLTFP